MECCWVDFLSGGVEATHYAAKKIGCKGVWLWFVDRKEPYLSLFNNVEKDRKYLKPAIEIVQETPTFLGKLTVRRLLWYKFSQPTWTSTLPSNPNQFDIHLFLLDIERGFMRVYRAFEFSQHRLPSSRILALCSLTSWLHQLQTQPSLDTRMLCARDLEPLWHVIWSYCFFVFIDTCVCAAVESLWIQTTGVNRIETDSTEYSSLRQRFFYNRDGFVTIWHSVLLAT